MLRSLCDDCSRDLRSKWESEVIKQLDLIMYKRRSLSKPYIVSQSIAITNTSADDARSQSQLNQDSVKYVGMYDIAMLFTMLSLKLLQRMFFTSQMT